MITLLRNKKAALEELDKSLKNRSEYIAKEQQKDLDSKSKSDSKEQPDTKDKSNSKY
ncbi:hypothetical protein BCO_0094601 [Borrelia coriaceae ATCC 43381]|uniref:Uncharacterized protein n=1 Tax=Borrelia coriaceae ATCC 43381 TaxID=1408429 RepID=W5SUN8_9SPIR|nr:hypothetical protein [Borrelia coriaceae]AHH10368.1 hypothetical protein BCO_0094601 [Borrelia coriaceae ATCC 43381]